MLLHEVQDPRPQPLSRMLQRVMLQDALTAVTRACQRVQQVRAETTNYEAMAQADRWLGRLYTLAESIELVLYELECNQMAELRN
jgi:hypothetical protein